MTPTRRGFFGRITGGLVALLGGKRAAKAQEAPLVVPDEWRSLVEPISKNPYLGMTIEEFAALPYRVYSKQVPYLKEFPVATPIPDPKDAAQAALDTCGIRPGQIYRHYKGGLYSIVITAIKEDTLEPLVVYRSNLHGTVFARTLENWNETIEKPMVCITSEAITGVTERVPRFSRVKE